MAKSFKNLMSEVAEPKSAGEKAFKAQHVIQKFDAQPAGQDHVFNGETPPKKRLADYLPGQDAAAYDQATKLPDIGNDDSIVDMGESTEEDLEEGILGAIGGAVAAHKLGGGVLGKVAGAAVGSAVQDRIAGKKKKEEDADYKVDGRRLSFKEKAKSLGYTKTEEVDADLEEARGPKPPQISKGTAKGSISAKGIRGKGMKKFDVDVSIDNGKFSFRIQDESGKFQTVNIKQAARMLGEEVEEQLDEISKELAGRYIKKAQVDSADAGRDTNEQDPERRKRGINKFLKRRKGTDMAVKRLMKKEEIDLEEAVKSGSMKLRSGETVKVSGPDAKLINQMLKDLNSSNRKQMEKVMMKDKAGFEEILGFAREAL